MRIFGLVLLVAVVAALSATVTVHAQGRATTARTTAQFIPVEAGRPNADTFEPIGLYVAEVSLSNGVTCYALSSHRFPRGLESLAQLEGFSCVK